MRRLKEALIFSLILVLSGSAVGQVGLEFTNTSLDMGGNDILNFFNQSACSSGDVVQRVYSNGSYSCVSVDEVSSVENLSTTLAAGNTANQTILFPNGIMLGSEASADDSGDVAIGPNADTQVSGDGNDLYETAVGQKSEATADQASAFGAYSNAVARYATAIGLVSNASGVGSTALGEGTTASGNRSIALGSDSTASGNRSIAIGETSNATAEGAVAVGKGSSAEYPYTVTFGDPSGQTYSVNITGNLTVGGRQALVMKSNSAEIRNFFNQTQCGKKGVVQQVYPNGSYNCTDVGSLSSTENLSETLAAGNTANTSIVFSEGLEIGNDQTSSSTSGGVALGKNSSTGSDDAARAATAVGSDSNASGRASVAIGQSANTKENFTSTFGGFSNATGKFSLALGYGSEASAKGSVAIGPKAQSLNPYQTTIGNLRGQRQNLNVTGNVTLHGNTIRFEGNREDTNITNFFNQNKCGAGEAVKRIFSNGSYICLDIVTVSGDENLSDTLAQGNSAGEYNIDLNTNNLTNADTIYVERQIDLQDADISNYFADKCPTNYGLTQVFPNGSYKCETGLVPGPYPTNLSDTLSVGQSAGDFFIDMNNNSIRNISYLELGYGSEQSYIEVDRIGPDRDDLTVDTTGNLRLSYGNPLQLVDSGTKIASIGSSAFNLNSTIELGDGSSLTSDGQNLVIEAPENYNISLESENVTLNNSELRNYFGDACSSNSSIQGIYPNGTFQCLEISAASGTEDLETTLSQGNNAGSYKINMSGNRIVNLSDPEDAQDAVTKSYLQTKTANSTDISDNGVKIVQSTLDINFGDGIAASDDGDRTATVSVNSSDLGATGTLNETLQNGNNAGNNSIDMNGNDIEMNGGNVTAGNTEEFCIGYCGG